jgi:hypothetical protein
MSDPVKFCTTPEHQPRYLVADVGRVMCPICKADVPSPRPEGARHEGVHVTETIIVKDRTGR